MANPYWPLFDLVVRTARLEIRYPDDELLVELAGLAAKGIHDPASMPFLRPWTRAASPDLERAALRHWWESRAAWTPERWNFVGAVLVDGRPVGIQAMHADAFAVTRVVSTGSWLGLEHQGRGFGREMRAGVLHLAFAGLGAAVACSGAFDDNPASLGVSRALGYVENGDEIHDREGKPAREIRLKLERDVWERTARSDVEVEGLDACLDWFGVAT
jgi:RimJ/RimL family protein N-acetyltransferase